MQPTIAEARPPYVAFERVAIEDRAASDSTGRYAAKDQDWAYITPQGSKDRIPRIVNEWFEQLEQQVREERFPASWLAAYKEAYKRWKENQTVPENGTPIVSWPQASPAMVKNLLTWNIRTVEDLAVANEETLNRLGMGGRDLKQKAISWLAAAENLGKAATEAARTATENEFLREQNKLLTEQLAVMKQQVALLTAGAGHVQAQPSAEISINDLLDPPAPPTAVPPGSKRL